MEKPEIKPNNDQNASSDLQRKITLLSKALIKEREDGQRENEELEQLKKLLKTSETNLADKNSKVLWLNSEKERIETEIEKTKEQIKNVASFTPAKNTKVTVASLEEQNKKLLDEYYTLKQQSTDLKNMKETLIIEHSEIKRKIKEKELELVKVKQDSSNLITQSENNLIKAENDLLEQKNSLSVLQEEQKVLKNTLEDIKNENYKLELDIEENNQKVLMIQGKIAALQQQLLKLSENESMLSEKLMDYKNELAEAETFYQKHEVLKVTPHGTFEISITLKKDYNGNPTLEIEQVGFKKISSDMWHIEKVGMVSGSENRFYVKISDNEEIVFQSGKSESIVNKMNRFISRSKQSY